MHPNTLFDLWMMALGSDDRMWKWEEWNSTHVHIVFVFLIINIRDQYPCGLCGFVWWLLFQRSYLKGYALCRRPSFSGASCRHFGLGGPFPHLGSTLEEMGAAEWTREGPEWDDGKHSLEWLGLQWESVSLLNWGAWGDWAGAAKHLWDFHTFCRYLLAHFFGVKSGS